MLKDIASANRTIFMFNIIKAQTVSNSGKSFMKIMNKRVRFPTLKVYIPIVIG